MAPEAGWYADPAKPEGDHERYWDGTRWTDQTRTGELSRLPPPPDVPAAPAQPEPVTTQTPRVSSNVDAASRFQDVAAGGGSALLDRIRGVPRPVVLGLVGLLVVGGVTRVAGLWGSPRSDTIRGLFALTIFDLETLGENEDWDQCEGSGGYSDIDAGVPVRIENEDGKRIGAATLQNMNSDIVRELAQLELDGKLETGLRLQDDGPPEDIEREEGDTVLDALAGTIEATLIINALAGGCTFYWEAEVDRAEVYNFDIGRRGDIDIDRDELVDDGFLVTFGIGS